MAMNTEDTQTVSTANAAATAAALIKSTAETTATALNIQYIQRDILDIKGTLKSMADAQETKQQRLEERVDNLAKMVWIGMGIAVGISFLSPFLQKLFIK